MPAGGAPYEAVDPDPEGPELVAAAGEAAHRHIAVGGDGRPHAREQGGQRQGERGRAQQQRRWRRCPEEPRCAAAEQRQKIRY